MAEAGSESGGDSQILYQTFPCRGKEAHRSRFRLHSGVGSGASMTQVDSLVDFILNQSKSQSDWLFGTQNRFIVIRILKTTKRLPKLSPPPANAASYSTTHLHREQNNIAISSLRSCFSASFHMANLDDLPGEVIDIIAECILDQEQGTFRVCFGSSTGPVCVCSTTASSPAASTTSFVCRGSALLSLASVSRHTRNVLFGPRFAQKALVREHTVPQHSLHDPSLNGQVR